MTAAPSRLGAQVTFNLDGYFGLNTLTEGNQAPRIFNSVLTDSTIVDSNPTGTTNGDGTIPQAPITVVNTPVGSNYMLSPFAGNLAQPLNLQLGTVQAAGVTGSRRIWLDPAAITVRPISQSSGQRGDEIALSLRHRRLCTTRWARLRVCQPDRRTQRSFA